MLRRLAAAVSVGEFYNGTRTELRGSAAVIFGPRLNVAAGLTRNLVSLPVPNGDFTATVADLTVKAAAGRHLFTDVLLQYDDVSRRVQSNLRVNWIHTPGSNLFVVFDTGYNAGDLLDPRDTRWERRTGVVKLTYLWAI